MNDSCLTQYLCKCCGLFTIRNLFHFKYLSVEISLHLSWGRLVVNYFFSLSRSESYWIALRSLRFQFLQNHSSLRGRTLKTLMFGINIWKRQQQNCSHKGNRSRSNLGIGRYVSVHNDCCTLRLLSRIVKFETFQTTSVGCWECR